MEDRKLYDFRLETMEKKLDKIIESLEHLDEKFVSKKEHQLEKDSMDSRISKLEEIFSKVNWTIIGTVLLGVLALVIKVGTK